MSHDNNNNSLNYWLPAHILLLLIFVIIMHNNPHLLLGRIRLLNRCIECLKRSEPMPESLCFVPKEVCYKVCKDSSFNSSAPSGVPAGGSKTLIPVFENPLQTPHIKKLCKYNIELKKGTCIRTTGEEYRNSQGLWVKITKVNFMHSLWIFSQIIPFTHLQWMTFSHLKLFLMQLELLYMLPNNYNTYYCVSIMTESNLLE